MVSVLAGVVKSLGRDVQELNGWLPHLQGLATTGGPAVEAVVVGLAQEVAEQCIPTKLSVLSAATGVTVEPTRNVCDLRKQAADSLTNNLYSHSKL